MIRWSSALVVLFALVSPCVAQVPLEPGPHAVGFRTIEARDSTRAFRPKRDWTGAPTGDTSRPVRISLWYPALPTPDAPVVHVRDYFRLARDELAGRPPEPGSAEADRARTAFLSLASAMGAADSAAHALWDAPTPARFDAAPAPGRHPVVLYFTSAGSGNPGLPAYLASHGFVVASFPSNGRMTETSLEFTPNALTLDTDIDEAGFVWSVVRTLAFVDPARLATAAFSSGSLALLLWQMRDMQADVIVTMEGWERYHRGAEIVRASPHYDPGRIRVPFLMMERGADEASPDYARVPFVVDSLHHADLRRLVFRDAAHGDFMSLPLGRTDPAVFPAAAHMVELFLSGVLMGDDDAAARLASTTPATAGVAFTANTRVARPAPPTEEELYRLAETDPARAAEVWSAIRGDGPPPFRRHVLTRAAVFAATDAERATILRIVVDAFPRSVDARFRLAQALIASGQTTDGAMELREALTHIDEDTTLNAEQRTAWRQRIEARLAEIG